MTCGVLDKWKVHASFHKAKMRSIGGQVLASVFQGSINSNYHKFKINPWGAGAIA